MDERQAMLYVVGGIGQDGITMRQFFERTGRLMGHDFNVDQMAEDCGFDPDAVVYPGEHFKRQLGAI
jgi:hypothetical protein